jgi:riboflavin synthase
MFTGLIQSLGCVKSVSDCGDGKTLLFSVSEDVLSQISVGDSIAVNGVCSTATSITDSGFTVDYLEESLKKSSMGDLNVGDFVNIELCLTLQTRLGGHMVSGHVDTVGIIDQYKRMGDFHVFRVSFNADFAALVIPKGSIALDGISLTIVDVGDDFLSCHIIPHTYEQTVLHKRQVGDKLNVEFDMVGKYLLRFQECSHAS